MKNISAIIFIFSVILLSAFPVSASGDNSMPFINANGSSFQQNKTNNKVKSSSQAARLVKSRVGGKVLKVNGDGRSYRVKIIKNNGHIINVTVDAKSGRIR